MVSEVADEEKEALEAAVLKEEAKDKEAEASKDYTGLIPEVRSTNTTTIITTTPTPPSGVQDYSFCSSRRVRGRQRCIGGENILGLPCFWGPYNLHKSILCS